jgi:murein DD-endopeptidase MepM/ murein hydrolase activator NlpD
MRNNFRKFLCEFILTLIILLTSEIIVNAANLNSLSYPFSSMHRITSPFGWRIHPIEKTRKFHSGIDIAADVGDPVAAVRDGKVVYEGDRGGYGKAIIIEHSNPRQQTLYAHLSRIKVSEGDYVKRGNIIGSAGQSGNTNGPHLHFEVLELTDGDSFRAINPILRITKLAGSTPKLAKGSKNIAPCSTALFGDCELDID